MQKELPARNQQPSKAALDTDSSLNPCDCPPDPPAPSKLKKRIGPFSFHLSAVVGRGFSSVVYRGVREGGRGEEVALKVVQLEGMSPHRRRLLEQEAAILKTVQHPHIVSLIDIYYSAHNCYIVTEFCEGGSLQTQLDRQLPVDWPSAASQVATALRYLSARHIIHRDLKPANVFLKDGLYKLGDFGFACELSGGLPIEEKYLIGSPLYMSPESLGRNVYSLRGDSFAFGVFLYYLATRRFPWKGRDKHELMLQYEKRAASQRPLERLPPKLKHFLNGLLEREAERRLGVWEVDLELFPRVRAMANAEEQIRGLSGSYEQQIKMCQFIHFLMSNFQQCQQLNAFLLPLISQHLGQLVEVLGWHRQVHMNRLKDNYQLPQGEFQFSCDQYHWLNNCLKDTILLTSSQGLLLKLLQYQRLVECLMYGTTDDICSFINSLTLHQTFECLRPSKEEIGAMMQAVDFYQL